MRNGLNKKIFNDKILLQKTLPKYIKKTLLAIANGKASSLPFYYEAAHFEDGSPFIAIGEAKEVHKIFKTERVKGNGGKDENGKIIKINKKLVAYGDLCLTEEGGYEFQIQTGFIKKQQLKACINSITILKQTIGQNFTITKGGVPVKEEESLEEEMPQEQTKEETVQERGMPQTETPTSDTNTSPYTPQQWAAITKKMSGNLTVMKDNLEKLRTQLIG
jgi:hypothetical protein